MREILHSTRELNLVFVQSQNPSLTHVSSYPEAGREFQLYHWISNIPDGWQEQAPAPLPQSSVSKTCVLPHKRASEIPGDLPHTVLQFAAGSYSYRKDSGRPAICNFRVRMRESQLDQGKCRHPLFS